MAKLIFEDELPEMTDSEYNDWFRHSIVHNGVRMGPDPNSEIYKLSEYNFQCDTCGSTGNDTHARMFFKKIRNQWVHLCDTCWTKHK